MFILGGLRSVPSAVEFCIVPGDFRDCRADAGQRIILGHHSLDGRDFEAAWPLANGDERSRWSIVFRKVRWPRYFRNLLVDHGHQFSVGKPRRFIRRTWSIVGCGRSVDLTQAAYDEIGRFLMPPVSSTERDLGKLLAAVEYLTDINKQDREDGRERSKKLDYIADGLVIVNEKLREQSRAALEQEARFNASLRDVKHAAANSSQVLTSRMDLVTINIEKIESRVADAATKMAALASEQAKIRSEVADVKSDTHKLQAPVNQLVSVRRAIIAWGGGIIVVTGYVFWLFRAGWDELIQHVTASFLR
jgi:hypothetical protein